MSLTPFDLHKFDEDSTELLDLFPTFFGKLYKRLQDEGFTQAQAFELVTIHYEAVLCREDEDRDC